MIILGHLDHNKKFRLNSVCNGKSLKDLKQRSDMIQGSFWLLLLVGYTREGKYGSGKTMRGYCRNPGKR